MLFLMSVVAVSMLLPAASHPEDVTASDEIENQSILNHPWDDYAPFAIQHEKFLIFQSGRPGANESHDLWYSFNRNYRDRRGKPEWSVPLPLSFPLDGEPSKTMQNQKPGENPPGFFSPNSDAFEGHPCVILTKGRAVELYFTSRAENGRPGFAGLNIYYARYRNDRWSEVRHINEINSDFDDRMAYVTPDGHRMFFVSNRPGGYGGDDIWYTERDMATGLWAPPLNMGPGINSEADEITPFLTANGQRLTFSSNRKGGMGGFDIYFSRWNEMTFEPPMNAGAPFNSERDDEAFKVIDDGTIAYFASDRRAEEAHTEALGRFDIYRVRVPEELVETVRVTFLGKILDGGSRLPLGMDATIHIEYEHDTLVLTSKRTVKTSGETIGNNFQTELPSGQTYRVRISAPGYHPYETTLDYRGVVPAGRKDERTFFLEPIRKSIEADRTLEGIIIDDATGLPLPGSRVGKRESDGNVSDLAVSAEGRFAIPVKKGEKFELAATSHGYLAQTVAVTESPDIKQVIVRMKADKTGNPCQGGSPDCIGNQRIYFPLNDARIPAGELKKLQTLAELLKKNPTIRIEIQGHTDLTYRGPKPRSHAYNLQLSLRRAEAVKKKLEELGVKPAQLTVRGYSFDRPIVPVRDSVRGAVNRRVEFKKIN